MLNVEGKSVKEKDEWWRHIRILKAACDVAGDVKPLTEKVSV